jgi:hypothetical protein
MLNILLLSLSMAITFSLSLINGEEFKLCFDQLHSNECIIDATSLEKEESSQKPWEHVEAFSLTTESGVNVPVVFHNRNSNVLIVTAQALPTPKESMKIFTKIFPHYDIIMFDYRWSGHYESFLCTSIATGKPIKKIWGCPR